MLVLTEEEDAPRKIWKQLHPMQSFYGCDESVEGTPFNDALRKCVDNSVFSVFL